MKIAPDAIRGQRPTPMSVIQSEAQRSRGPQRQVFVAGVSSRRTCFFPEGRNAVAPGLAFETWDTTSLHKSVILSEAQRSRRTHFFPEGRIENSPG